MLYYVYATRGIEFLKNIQNFWMIYKELWILPEILVNTGIYNIYSFQVLELKSFCNAKICFLVCFKIQSNYSVII